MLEEKMMEKKVWAVVGANNDSSKHANMIYLKLRGRGYTTYAVNPKYEEVEGDKCYADLSSLPEKPDVIEIVVAPKNGKKYVEEAKKLGLDNFWLQPGTYDDEFIELLEQNGLKYVKACILVALR